jgi:predicted glycosyltransferase
MARILVHVQHLLGIGHLKRAATLARGLAEAGHAVTLASGGVPVDVALGRARLLQLPPARALDASFKRLVDDGDRPIDDAWRERRRRALIDAFDEIGPEALVIEMFPFGRRAFRFELIPLLERARSAGTTVFGSVRDILVHRPRADREAEFLDTVRRFFDRILVHGDPGLAPLELSFPLAHAIGDKLLYTGYLLDLPKVARQAGGPGSGEVIVSAGGGAVGEKLLETALQARACSSLGQVPWRLLVGPNLSHSLDRLRCMAPAGVVVEPARPDFVQLVANCLISISQAGYNTMMELMAVGARAVVVPFAQAMETEQTLRAELLAKQGLVEIVPEHALDPAALARAVDRAIARPPGRGPLLDLSGLETSVRLIGAEIAEAG